MTTRSPAPAGEPNPVPEEDTLTTTTPDVQRPSKPHLADRIALSRGIQVTDLHVTRVHGYPTFVVTGEGRDGHGRRILIGGTVPAGRRPAHLADLTFTDLTFTDPSIDNPFADLL